MIRTISLGAAILLMGACNDSTTTTTSTSDSANVMTNDQATEEWQPLLSGNSLTGWHAYGKNTIGQSWKVQDGELTFDPSVKDGGDIVTDEEYENFHLKLQWKIDSGGNSGIMFYVHEDTSKYQNTWNTGPEMQVLDNERHADAKINKHRAGDLYDLIAANPETVKPAGEWNDVEIKAENGNLLFRLNGTDVVQTTMWDDNWKNMIANSKFKEFEGFGTYKKGRIALQDHGDKVYYRNIMIRKL